MFFLTYACALKAVYSPSKEILESRLKEGILFYKQNKNKEISSSLDKDMHYKTMSMYRRVIWNLYYITNPGKTYWRGIGYNMNTSFDENERLHPLNFIKQTSMEIFLAVNKEIVNKIL